jgi:phosphoribosylanthranilate isomerase
MKVKICGLTEKDHVFTCIDNSSDFCGFILNYPKSHRNISFKKAHLLTDIEKKNTQFVGVLVKPKEEDLKKFSNLNIDYFQLYGDFSEQDLFEIKKKFKKKIIYSIQVKKKKDVRKYELYKDVADIILFDSSGYEKSLSWNFDWIKDIPITKMIAGNINIDMIEKIYSIADIIDVSGALETNKVKDVSKIKSFLKKIKTINNET